MKKLPKLKSGDKVAILSPSMAAPGRWPEVYAVGLERLKSQFGLVPVEFPATAKLGATGAERTADLIAAFADPEIKAVITTLGGNDQVTYVKNISSEIIVANPKPFFGYSDNTHFCNFLWLHGMPSYYGGSVLTQFAMQSRMDDLTVEFLKHALFDSGEYELPTSSTYNEQGMNWFDPIWKHPETMIPRPQEQNDGWYWDGSIDVGGITWGGCLESIDEMLRHGVLIPTPDQLSGAVLMLETSEEIPDAQYVHRVLRALGERGILASVRAVLVGRPKAWHYGHELHAEQKAVYRKEQREIMLQVVRQYNSIAPVVQNMDFGHTDPQIAMPYGGEVRIDSVTKKIYALY